MATPPAPRGASALHRIPDLIPLVIGAWIAWRVLATMAGRLEYGFDLEWMEGGMLGHAWQLVHGRPVYPNPEPGHVAFVYPPGYTALLAFLSDGFGLGYPLGRAISVVSTVVGAAILAVGAKRQGGHWAAGLCGAALYLSLFNASGGFYDLVRPDALGIALLGAAVVVGLERHRGADLASGLLLACAFAVKHNLAVFGVPLLVQFWLLGSRQRALRFAAASIGPALLFTGFMQWVSGGNFLRFLLGIPGSHPLNGTRGFPGTPDETAQYLLPGLVGAAVYLALRAVPRVDSAALSLPIVLGSVLGAWAPGLLAQPYPPWSRELLASHLGFSAMGAIAGCLIAVAVDSVVNRRPDGRWVVGCLLAGVSIGIAGLMRAHHGGFINVLMPLHWMTCFGLAVVAGRARNQWPALAPGLTAAVMAMALLWSGSKLELERLVPTPEDTAAGNRVVAEIAACPEGPVYSPYAAWLPVLAGREPSAHLIGVWDINHERSPFRDDLERFRTAAAEGYWGCVVEGGVAPLEAGVDVHYVLSHRLPLKAGELMTKTGWRARPNAIHLHRGR